MDTTPTQTDAQEASAEAVHKQKNAAQAIESAREAQLADAVEKTAVATKNALLEGLKEVFGASDNQDPNQMRILVRRIPILCTNIETMHADIASIKSNITWAVRAVVGAVIIGLLALLFK